MLGLCYKGLTAAIVQADFYSWIVLILITAAVLISLIYPYVSQWLSQCGAVFKKFTRSNSNGVSDKITIDELNEIVSSAGYKYDLRQDIFYSHMYPWQRNLGYCRLYDEAAAPMGMIIDCEPIYFEYDNKRWMIELWKGQYDLTTGCEIGVYYTEEPDLDIPDVFNGTFYYCAKDEDLLQMSYTLKKNGRTLFTRKDKHWWLTGFKLGEFSEPSELSMDINITLKDKTMRNAFLKGLIDSGYQENEIIQNGNTVRLKFDKPRTPQPLTRTESTDWIIQRKNEQLCNTYQEITHGHDNTLDKIIAIQKQAPDIYEIIINLGKSKHLYDAYETIKNHLI